MNNIKIGLFLFFVLSNLSFVKAAEEAPLRIFVNDILTNCDTVEEKAVDGKNAIVVPPGNTFLSGLFPTVTSYQVDGEIEFADIVLEDAEARSLIKKNALIMKLTALEENIPSDSISTLSKLSNAARINTLLEEVDHAPFLSDSLEGLRGQLACIGAEKDTLIVEVSELLNTYITKAIVLLRERSFKEKTGSAIEELERCRALSYEDKLAFFRGREAQNLRSVIHSEDVILYSLFKGKYPSPSIDHLTVTYSTSDMCSECDKSFKPDIIGELLHQSMLRMIYFSTRAGTTTQGVDYQYRPHEPAPDKRLINPTRQNTHTDTKVTHVRVQRPDKAQRSSKPVPADEQGKILEFGVGVKSANYATE
ncbi:MAG: hypothetical protein LBM19_01160 [Holosporales bacterium]|nr:hypothetical protein [Holosporales bacterium]